MKTKVLTALSPLLYYLKFWFIFVCLALKIQVSDTTAELLHTLRGYILTCRGTLNVKVIVLVVSLIHNMKSVLRMTQTHRSFLPKSLGEGVQCNDNIQYSHTLEIVRRRHIKATWSSFIVCWFLQSYFVKKLWVIKWYLQDNNTCNYQVFAGYMVYSLYSIVSGYIIKNSLWV